MKALLLDLLSYVYHKSPGGGNLNLGLTGKEVLASGPSNQGLGAVTCSPANTAARVFHT